MSFEKSVFLEFGSLEDSSSSVHRKRVPQVRAREDNLYGYRGSLVLVKMILTYVLTRVLASLPYSWLAIPATIG